MFIVFDLDGTLANQDHRVHHITGETKNWDAFFSACGGDMPIECALEVLDALERSGRKHRIEIWTGRSDQVRDETIEWLMTHLPFSFAGVHLRMRASGDHRNDDILKAEWTKEFGKPDLVFEDRDRVVAMWRSLGIPCFQVAPGAF